MYTKILRRQVSRMRSSGVVVIRAEGHDRRRWRSDCARWSRSRLSVNVQLVLSSMKRSVRHCRSWKMWLRSESKVKVFEIFWKPSLISRLVGSVVEVAIVILENGKRGGKSNSRQPTKSALLFRSIKHQERVDKERQLTCTLSLAEKDLETSYLL